MKTYLAIGAAGALGALARTGISVLYPMTDGFPAGTFAVNIAGAFILCFLVERTLQWTLVNKTVFDAISVGFLGSFTTFSTFSFETLSLAESSPLQALLYIGASLIAGLAAGSLGIVLGGRRQDT